jgi:hypothetical protein
MTAQKEPTGELHQRCITDTSPEECCRRTCAAICQFAEMYTACGGTASSCTKLSGSERRMK